MPGRDLYDILGVGRDVSAEELKKAFRKLALQHHPDRKGSEEAFKEVSAAYAVLSDPEKRSRYDRFGEAGLQGGGMQAGSVEDLFSAVGAMFGGDLFGGRFERSGPEQGAHLQCEVEISLEEAALGATRAVTIERPEPCEACSGTGAKKGTSAQTCPDCRGAGVIQSQQGFFLMRRTCGRCRGAGEIVPHPCPACRGRARIPAEKRLEVKIPAGVEDGMHVRLPAQGEPGDRGGPRGDLYCTVHVREHPLFRRDGVHLLCQVPASFAQAALGASIEVPTLTGKATLEIPPGTQPGEVLRLKGEGCPDLRTGRRGDLHARIEVEVPKKLAKEQEDLLRAYAKSEDKNVSPARKSFLDKIRETLKEREKHG